MATSAQTAQPRQVDYGDRWLASKDAAYYLGVEVSTLSKWRQQGIGPEFSCRMGRDPRYRLSVLEAYMSEAVTTTTTEARTIRRANTKRARLI